MNLGVSSPSCSEETASDGPHYCPHCGRLVPPLTVELLGRKLEVQPHCECEWRAEREKLDEIEERYKKDRIMHLFSVSKLGDRFAQCRFESFEERLGTETALQVCRKYADTFDPADGIGVLLWGNPGTGKSHLAAAVCHALLHKGYTVVFQSVPELLGRLRDSYGNGGGETEREIMRALMDADLVVLDDLGAEKVTDWTLDTLFRLVDGRYRAKRAMIVTTNVEASAISDYVGEKIADRLYECLLPVQVRAGSYRRQRPRDERFKKIIPDNSKK